MPTLPEYHTNADGTVPCTNCGENIKPTAGYGYDWRHLHGRIYCDDNGMEVACPLPPNDDDPDFYDQHGWAKS